MILIELPSTNHDNRIDLTTADSVHIMEPHWNPMVESQAVDRVHRIGQRQDVEVVRYIVQDSIELVSHHIVIYGLSLRLVI